MEDYLASGKCVVGTVGTRVVGSCDNGWDYETRFLSPPGYLSKKLGSGMYHEGQTKGNCIAYQS